MLTKEEIEYMSETFQRLKAAACAIEYGAGSQELHESIGALSYYISKATGRQELPLL